MSTTKSSNDPLPPPTPTTPPPPTSSSPTRLTHPSKLLFRRHLAHLQHRLHPLISVASGQAHPAFPASILHYHLLTEAQLDALAHWYHQRTPGPLSFSYPAPVITRWDRSAGIEDKRRRFGRFIGLRGCESPVVAVTLERARRRGRVLEEVWERRVRMLVAGTVGGEVVGREGEGREDGDLEIRDCETQEEMERVIERRVRRAIEREIERDVWRRKGF